MQIQLETQPYASIAADALVTYIFDDDKLEGALGEINKSMDDGRYADAIASFTKAVEADPNNQATQELLTRARTAQQTEEQLLKNRHLP